MRDTHRLKEKYELSLDNRQIVSLSVAAVVVLGGTFLLGVVVGKKLSIEQGGEKPPADLLSQLDQKTAALDKLAADDASLTYQDELTKKAPPVVPTPAPAPVAKPAPKPEPAKAEVAKSEPAEPAKPDAEPKVAVPEKPAPEPVEVAALPESPKPEPVATRTHDAGGLKEAFARAQRPPVPTETAADGSWTLQLAAYQDKAEADRFAAGLRDKGYAPYLVEATIPNKGVWYRVRMGRFANKDAASRYLTDFKRETSMTAIVTQ